MGNRAGRKGVYSAVPGVPGLVENYALRATRGSVGTSEETSEKGDSAGTSCEIDAMTCGNVCAGSCLVVARGRHVGTATGSPPLDFPFF